MTRTLLIMPVLLLAALLAACGGGGNSTQTGSVPAVNSMADSPGFPGIPTQEPPAQELPRNSSVALEFGLSGGSAFDFNGVQEAPAFMRLTPSAANDIRFAIYQLPQISPQASFSSINVVLSELTTGADYHFAFADYSSGRWELTSREAPGSAMNVELSGSFDAARHISPAGNLYLAVVVDGSLAVDCVVEQLDFSLEQPLGIPVIDFATQGTSEQAISIGFTGVNGAESYDIFYKEEVQPDTEFALLDSKTEDGFDFFSHSADFPVGKEAEYGVRYEYVMLARAGLEFSEFSESVIGFRQTPQPTLFTTQRALTDRVELAVAIGNVPVSYTVDLFRGADLVLDDEPLLESFGQILTDDFSDLAQPLAGPLSYTAIVNGPNGPSLASEPVTGCIAEWSAEVLVSSDAVNGFFADMDDAADASVAGAAYVVYNELAGQILYLLDDGGLGTVKVADAQTAMHPAIVNHLGVPWVAYLKTDAVNGNPGIYLARGSAANPVDGGSFSSIPLVEVTPLGSQIRMEEVDGRLAMMFAIESSPGFADIYYAYAQVADPQLASDWTFIRLMGASIGSLPLEFDFADLEGRPAAMYLEPTNVGFFIADDSSPSSGSDFKLHFATAVSGFEPPNAVDVMVHEGRFHAAYLYGDTEEDIVIGYMQQKSDTIPASPFDWETRTSAILFDKRVRDVAVVIADDGIPLIVLRNADSDWPEVLRPQLNASGEFLALPWTYGPIFPNEQFREINQFLKVGIRAMLHDGQVHILAESTFDEDAIVQELHVLKLGLKPEL